MNTWGAFANRMGLTEERTQGIENRMKVPKAPLPHSAWQ